MEPFAAAPNGTIRTSGASPVFEAKAGSLNTSRNHVPRCCFDGSILPPTSALNAMSLAEEGRRAAFNEGCLPGCSGFALVPNEPEADGGCWRTRWHVSSRGQEITSVHEMSKLG